jgi:hypothetical protein
MPQKVITSSVSNLIVLWLNESSCCGNAEIAGYNGMSARIRQSTTQRDKIRLLIVFLYVRPIHDQNIALDIVRILAKKFTK